MWLMWHDPVLRPREAVKTCVVGLSWQRSEERRSSSGSDRRTVPARLDLVIRRRQRGARDARRKSSARPVWRESRARHSQPELQDRVLTAETGVREVRRTSEQTETHRRARAVKIAGQAVE